MANTFPIPANFVPADPQGPAPFSEIETDRWKSLLETTNLAYGTGNIQIANMAWDEDICTTGAVATVPYAGFASIRIPVLSALHTEIDMRVYGGYNPAGGGTYSRISIQVPASAANRVRTVQINSATPQWWANEADTLTIPTAGDYYELEVGAYYSTFLRGMSIMALAGNATAYPGAAGSAGTTVDGDFTPLDPALTASDRPVSSMLASILNLNATALLARRRPLLFGFGNSIPYTGGALYNTPSPKRMVTPVFRPSLGQTRNLVVHAKATNTSVDTRYIYVQHAIGGERDLHSAWGRQSSNGVTRIAVAGSFSGWLNDPDGYTFDLVPSPCRVAGQSDLYPAFQVVGIWWDDEIDVESYSMWEEE